MENVLPSVRQNIEEEIARDKASLAELKKPTAPAEFKLNEITDSVIEKAKRNRRLPGEEMYSLELAFSEPISSQVILSTAERGRRNELSKTTVYLILTVDGKIVCKTSPRPISETFEVTFGSILTVYLNEIPKKLVVEIVQSQGLLSSRTLSQVCLPLPESTLTQTSAELTSYNFSSLISVSHGHAGVGSNVEVGTESRRSLVNGNFICSAFWTQKENGDILAPKNIRSKQFDCFRKNYVGQSGTELGRLVEWAKKANLDPNDVENAEILELIQASSRKSKIPGYFRLNSHEHHTDFVECGDTWKRFKLLTLRAQEVGQYGNCQFVPAFDSEIQESLLMTGGEDEVPAKGDLNQFEMKQRIIRSYLRLVYENILKNIRKSQKQRTFAQIVQEIEISPQIWGGIPDLFKPRRPLRPKRIARTVDVPELVKRVVIFVHIRQAWDLPLRISSTTKRDVTALPKNLNVFAEVRFLDKVRRTRGCANGTQNWNEKLEISFDINDLNVNDKHNLPANPYIFVNIYDKIEIVSESESRRERRFNKILLGGLRIPFSTLYTNSKIEGKFKIDRPRLQTGYICEQGPSLLDLFVTIDPILDKGTFAKIHFDSEEANELIIYAERWVNDFKKQFPNRHCVALVLDMNAKMVFSPRFLHSIPPPEVLFGRSKEGTLTREERVARFVSLFPNVSDTFLYSGVEDLWSTCDQFISVRLGDEEEHAILLYNFFNAMGKTVYLVAGTAIPDGNTFYLISEEGPNEFVIWNSVTGQHWPVEDSNGALKSVGCLLTAKNIFCNIQESSAPWEISFLTSVKKAWLPFFGTSFPYRPLTTVQSSFLNFSDPNEEFAQELVRDITHVLRERITTWRSEFITRWNRTCCRAFLNVIKGLEFNSQVEDSPELRSLSRSFMVSGYPFNLTFTTVQAAVEATFATGMHDIVGNDVEFALAVHVHAYPCDIYCVWIYFGNMIRVYDM